MRAQRARSERDAELTRGARNKMTREKRELSAPPDVEEQGGTEILRLFVTDGALSLSMQRAFEEPGMWGQLLADLAMHAAQIYARETPVEVAQALGEIRLAAGRGFRPDPGGACGDAELKACPDAGRIWGEGRVRFVTEHSRWRPQF